MTAERSSSRPGPARGPRDEWLLDPALTFLNHGSYGACPRLVLDAQTTWRARVERDPVRFLAAGLEPALDHARSALGVFLGADPDDLAWVPNATTGVNTVLASLAPEWGPGDELLTTDHEYNATLNALREAARVSRATLVISSVPFPVRSAEEVEAAVLAAVTPRTRFCLISHVTSATALILPVERIVASLSERGVDTLVDGAHAPGMVPLHLDRLGAAYYTGNGHKWLCGAKGSGFLHVRRDRQAGIRPLVTSHGANSPRRDRSRFRLAFDWTGTSDPTAFLVLPEAIDFMATLHPDGWPGVMAANRELCLAARDVVAATLGVMPPAPDEMIGAMAALPLGAAVERHLSPLAPAPGADPDETLPDDPLHDELLQRHRIQVPIYTWPPTRSSPRPPLRLVRISAQRYNALDEYRELARILRTTVRRDQRVTA
ncbi:MAG: aminotransferase class V-fold PLP-dependent enzyme [Chloroflexota bacterium]|nr:aminotransferase class V-fold PLP-dependent enzyme [Chloroflexota bacterium]